MELSDNDLAWAPYHRVLGQVVSVWDRVELSLQTLFLAVTKGSSKQLIAVFHASRSGDLRIDMIRNSIKHSPIKPELLETLSKLLDRIEKLSRTRNRIIHATWRLLYEPDGKLHRAKRPPVRISFIPDVDYARKIEDAYFNGKDQHLFQGEIAKFIFTAERMQAVCLEFEVLINEAYDLYGMMHPNLKKTEIEVPISTGQQPP